jgi:hypothetical protein
VRIKQNVQISSNAVAGAAITQKQRGTPATGKA